MSGIRLRLLSLLPCLALGCSDGTSPPGPPRSPPPRPERPLALRGAPAPAATPGESPAPTDDDPIARCVRRNREALGPELGSAVQSLGDDSLLGDACALDLAVRQRAPERCASLRLSGLRDVCTFRSAVAAARPDACPPSPGLRGRDPVCVALAARDASLCGAATATERARCLAVATGDARRCEVLDPLLRSGCLRDIEPLRAVASAVRRAEALAPDPARNVWSTPAGDAGVETPAPWLTRGVFVDGGGALWIVDASVGWPRDVAGDEGRVGVALVAARGAVTVLDAKLSVPGSGPMSTADGTLRATATLTRAATRRGGRVAGRVAFAGTSAGRLVTVELRFDTFVRDVVDAAALR